MRQQSGSRSLRVAFAGTPEFAVPALQAMISRGITPLAVLTQPDRPAGRGRRMRAGPVKQVALDQGIPVHQPASLSGSAAEAAVRELDLDLLVVVAYGQILPRSILQIPRHGCWNIHASMLPRWRGAAPIQRAIAAGDQRSGVCIMLMDEGLDSGPVLQAAETEITASDTGGTLHDRLAAMGAEALLECLERLQNGDPPTPVPQDDTRATYAPKLSKQEARIDWQEPAAVLARRIRAFNPWPVCWCELGGQRLRVWRAEEQPENGGQPPGTLIASSPAGIDVATASGALRLLEVQAPGGQRMAARDYLNAHPLQPAG